MAARAALKAPVWHRRWPNAALVAARAALKALRSLKEVPPPKKLPPYIFLFIDERLCLYTVNQNNTKTNKTKKKQTTTTKTNKKHIHTHKKYKLLARVSASLRRDSATRNVDLFSQPHFLFHFTTYEHEHTLKASRRRRGRRKMDDPSATRRTKPSDGYPMAHVGNPSEWRTWACVWNRSDTRRHPSARTGRVPYREHKKIKHENTLRLLFPSP